MSDRHSNRDPKSYTPPLKECLHCRREFRFLGRHTRFCVLNPSAPGPSEKQKLGRKASGKKRRLREVSLETRKRISISRRKAIAEGRVKMRPPGYWKSEKGFNSSWEEMVANYLDELGIMWSFPKSPFPYTYNGKSRLYTPDFYLNRFGVYLEVKGWTTRQDLAKWKSLTRTKPLLVITWKEIKTIKSKELQLRRLIRSSKEHGFYFNGQYSFRGLRSKITTETYSVK